MASAAHSRASAAHPDPAGLMDRYVAVRSLTEALCAPLTAEDMVIQSMPDVSPPKWHLAHTAWFFETFILGPNLPGYQPFHPRFGYLFNSYYNQLGPFHTRSQRGLLARPSSDEVLAYRAHVDHHLLALVGALDDRIWAHIEPLLTLGLNHEQQHQELLLMDIKHNFHSNPLRPAYREDLSHPPAGLAQPVKFLSFTGGLVDIGHCRADFAFDNEQPAHRAYLTPFRLADRLVTCGEYLEFLDAGGYQTPALWLSDGWTAVQARGWTAPLYWEHGEDGWQVFAASGLRPFDPAAPVSHLSYYEADAYARFAGRRLPTEFEWETAASQVSESPTGSNFLDRDLLEPLPAGSQLGLKQMFGDLWEWTASPYVPYPRFRPAVGAVGEYNGKFMSGQMVLRGGACVTPADHIRSTYRNFYPPDARWAYSGVRLAEDT
ncbi:MAG: ergothioneine biosynthesis protein EgtB [Immundisolibacter sp.]|uniref:ergothioneine biosynthesis protein EgtB n=1 Tax=Immundisolibacter sp. TaxID=1934948 RepID=UPI003EE2F9D1